MSRTLPLAVTLILLGACNPYPGTPLFEDPPVEDEVLEEEEPEDDEEEEEEPDCEPSEEVCDGIDNDCDGAVDEDAYDAVPFLADADGDGFGNDEEVVLACAAPYGFVASGGDCDDARADVNPDAVDTCDGVDKDCNPATGLVTLFTEDAAIDLTDAFVAGSADAPGLIVLDQAGELAVCEGTWFARLDIRADVAVEGIAGSERTVLDAAGAGTVVDLADNSVDASLVGLTLQNGLGSPEDACQAGGICVRGARLAGEDLVVTNNRSPGEGGGMALLGGAADLSEVVFSDNVASTHGGAIHVRPNGRLTLTDAELRANQAARGGALYQLGGASFTRMEQVRVEDNQASGSGGGLLIDNGTLRMFDSRLVANSAAAGGAVALVGVARPSLFERTTFEDNAAERGAALLMRRSAIVRDAQVFGNASSKIASAAIQVDGGQLTIETSDFEDADGEGNTPVDVRAGADQLVLGLDASAVCTDVGCGD